MRRRGWASESLFLFDLLLFRFAVEPDKLGHLLGVLRAACPVGVFVEPLPRFRRPPQKLPGKFPDLRAKADGASGLGIRAALIADEPGGLDVHLVLAHPLLAVSLWSWSSAWRSSFLEGVSIR